MAFDRPLSLEFEAEIDRGIDEVGHRGKRNHKGRWHAAEAQPNRKAMILDLQIPEAVLDDDRHLVRKALRQMLGDRNARHLGLEGDVEMVPARKAATLLDLMQYAADHIAQRLLHDLVVGD